MEDMAADEVLEGTRVVEGRAKRFEIIPNPPR